MDVSRHPLLKPTDSTASLGSSTPLVWVFNHFRQEGKTSLCKEDLQRLVGPQVDSVQLDQAFDNLDADRDGEVSMDEFIAGFARFWRDTPDTPSHKKYNFSFSPSHSLSSSVTSSLITRRRRLPSEEHYEYGGEEVIDEEDKGPNEQFQKTIDVLSSHNRHSMEQLWRSLKEANPELLTDFEDFVSEVALEVEGAQRALDNQRKANKKEAIELDNEIESRLSAAQTTLHIQTSLVRQEEKSKLERRLVEKESELFSVRNQLQELESEIVETQQNRQELEQHCQDLRKEKQELKEQLEVSERRLQSQAVSERSQADQPQGTGGTKIEQLDVQQKLQSHQEEELLQHKKRYEEEILKLKRELELYSKQAEHEATAAAEDEEVESLMKRGVARPDLLAAPDPDSLMQEIAAKEGHASPLLRKELVLLPSPFQRTRAGSMRKSRTPTTNLSRAASLPNLADVESLEALEPPPAQYRFSVLPPTQLDAPSPPVDNTFPLPDKLPLVTNHPSFPVKLFPSAEHTPLPAKNPDPLPPTTSAQGNHPAGFVPSTQGKTPQKPETLIQDPLLSRDQYEECCQALEFLEALPTQPDYIFKVLVVGNSYVGKSSYLMQLCNHSFSQRYSSTIGVDFYTKALKMDGKVVSLQLWDTAGQERFQSVTKAYYRGAQGVILMYDITQEESFIAVKSWINSIQENAEESPAAMCLVGNKQDMDAMKEREVSMETGETFAKIYGADFIETSAKTGFNVGGSLLKLVRSLKTYYENTGNKVTKKTETVQFTEDTTKQESKCCGR